MGDPAGLRTSIARLERTVDELDDIRRELRTVASEIRSRGEAANELREITGEVGEVVTRARTRYDGVRSALAVYVVTLDRVHGSSDALVAADQRAQDTLDDARRDRDYYGAVALVPGPDQPEMIERLRQAQAALSVAESEAQRSREALEQLREDLETAAQIAIQQIDAAMHSSGLNDDFWDYLRAVGEAVAMIWETYILPALQRLAEALEVIKDILSILSLILSIAAIFFPVLAGVAALLRVIVLLIEVLDLHLTVVLALNGRASLGEVIGGAISVALGFVGFKGDIDDLAKGVLAPIKGALKDAGLSGVFDPTVARTLADNFSGLANSPAAREALSWESLRLIFEPVIDTGKLVADEVIVEPLKDNFIIDPVIDFVDSTYETMQNDPGSLDLNWHGTDSPLVMDIGAISRDSSSAFGALSAPAADVVIDAVAGEISTIMQGALEFPALVLTPAAA